MSAGRRRQPVRRHGQADGERQEGAKHGAAGDRPRAAGAGDVSSGACTTSATHAWALTSSAGHTPIDDMCHAVPVVYRTEFDGYDEDETVRVSAGHFLGQQTTAQPHLHRHSSAAAAATASMM